MKRVIVVTALLVASASVSADQWVNGYYRGDGTYVEPHMRSTPNGSPFDNYSTRGNINPYTGNRGYVDPYGSDRSSRSLFHNGAID